MSKRGKRKVKDFVYNPMTGVQTDFSVLLKQFIDTGSVRYERFAEIWRSLKMPLIFSGRQSDAEVREFTEKCFDIAKTFAFGAKEFQTQVGGLYLLYALFFKQLFEPKAKIRITLDEWMQFQKFLEVAKAESHYDVEYIFWKLRHSNAFHFVAHPIFLSGLQQTAMEGGHEKAAQYQGSESEPILQDHSIISELVETDTIEQLKAIHEQYHKVKCAMVGPDAEKPEASLSMIDSDIVQQLNKKIRQFESWKKQKLNKTAESFHSDDNGKSSGSEEDSESDKEAPSTQRNIGQIRAALKAKAMGFTTEMYKSRYSTVGSSTESQRKTSKPQQKGQTVDSEATIHLSDLPVNALSCEVADPISMPTFTELEETKVAKRKLTGRRKGKSPIRRKGSSKSTDEKSSPKQTTSTMYKGGTERTYKESPQKRKTTPKKGPTGRKKQKTNETDSLRCEDNSAEQNKIETVTDYDSLFAANQCETLTNVSADLGQSSSGTPSQGNTKVNKRGKNKSARKH